MQISEDALMEKEQGLIREQQLKQEIGRLKKALATILQEAGERTRNEVLTVACTLSAMVTLCNFLLIIPIYNV